ncbi:MAG: MASE1 domain-containing protein [Leptolyngbyaceae cyanobacterium MO_188.B28]|nr:MASE1 domain-containing protein [Leptolyngbyaceae cyanobacterium MO_188.B28]
MYSQNPALLWRDIILLAFLYFVTARIGQLFAIPPGNVTPIWIPSGIIVVAIIYRGFRLWPGIFIGAFAGNIWAYFTTEPETALYHSLIAAFFNGAGDSLGAVLGAYLILLKCNTPYPLKRTIHFLYFRADL